MANNPLLLVRDHTLTEYKPDKVPVGKHNKQNVSFTKNTIGLQKGDMIYVFTDGYADQFGGENGKKLKHSALKELLENVLIKIRKNKKTLYVSDSSNGKAGWSTLTVFV